MTPATSPRNHPLDQRLLCVDPPSGRFEDRWMRDLPDLLRGGDLLVVNDAGTLPASLRGSTPGGESIEVRLAGQAEHEGEWTAVLFGRGDWRMRTEDRELPPPTHVGDVIRFGDGLAATLRRFSPVSPRIVDLAFDREGAAFWNAVYRLGQPIQYSYLQEPLELRQLQTAYAARPWAVEPPSAGRPLDWELLSAVLQRGIGLATITHAAGLSSTGDAQVDALLPFPERFDIPAGTVEAVQETRRKGGRVVAVGTTAVRALEGSAAGHAGVLTAGAGVTSLRITAGFRLRLVDGVLTGLHEPGTTHFNLLEALAPQGVLVAAYRHAEVRGYLGHEFGDSMLILGNAPRICDLSRTS